MKCSFEIPIAHIKELKEHQEFDFVLAQLWISNAQYREAYSGDMVMDNGAYELGEPIETKMLLRIVKAARPSVLIAPDWLDDVKRTVDEYKLVSTAAECEVAGVVVGNTIEEMLACYLEYQRLATHIICLPFRLNRIGFLMAAKMHNVLNADSWYHFLGLRSMEELKEIKHFQLPNTSVDTSKPIKAAIYGKTIHDDLRGLGHIDHFAEYDRETVDRMKFQVVRFREEAQA